MTMHRNNKDGSYNVRGYGGARKGAGRPPAGRHPITIRVTDDEEAALRKFLLEYREKMPADDQ